MAKSSPSGKKKRSPAAKKPRSKKSAAKKPASKKSASKKTDAGKPAAKKKPVAKKTSGKPAAGKKTTAAPKTAPKQAAAAPKSASRKSSKRSPARKSPQKPQTGPFGRFAGVYGVLLFLLVAAGLCGGIYAGLHGNKADPPNSASRNSMRQAEIPREIEPVQKVGGETSPPAPKQNGPAPSAPVQEPAPDPTPQAAAPETADTRPKVALIIDDMGHRLDMAEKFFNLNARFTYAILPYTRYQKEISEAAASRGYEVILHLPMEPNEYPNIDPGPGALMTGMTPDERIQQLKNNLDAVPHIKGVNNHMGSKMTAMFAQMNQLFTVLKKRGLFFIDSRTTAASQCRFSAQLFNLPFAERDVFLDHVQTREAVSEHIDELMNIAEIKGAAIGIGHPHEITYQLLAERLDEINRRVRLVPASALAKND